MEIPPLPPSIKAFRYVINLFKSNILQDKLLKEGKQDVRYFNKAGSDIQELGNILRYLVEGDIKCDDSPTIVNICTVFKEHNIDFSNITKEEHDLFLFYIKNDTYDAGYALHPELPKK